MSKFSKAPWFASGDYICDADGFTIATVDIDTPSIHHDYESLGYEHWADAPGKAHIERSEEEGTANAQLMTASPKLLEAAERVLKSAQLLLELRGIVIGGVEQLQKAVWLAMGRCEDCGSDGADWCESEKGPLCLCTACAVTLPEGTTP